MRIDDLSEDMWELLVGVRVCIRYHDRRRHFFVTAHRFTAATGAIFGTAAMAALFGKVDQSLGLAAAALVTSMSVIDLVIGFSESANLHRDLRRRFVELEQAIIADHDDARLGELQRRRLEIEKDEPPVRRALATLVQNEQILSDYPLADAAQYLVHVGWWQRLTAHLFAHATPSQALATRS